MKEGVQWLDTSQNPPVLKERRNGEWVPVSAISDYQKAREAAARDVEYATGRYDDGTMVDPVKCVDAVVSAFEAHGLVLVPKEITPDIERTLTSAQLFYRPDYEEWSGVDEKDTPSLYESIISAALQKRQKK